MYLKQANLAENQRRESVRGSGFMTSLIFSIWLFSSVFNLGYAAEAPPKIGESGALLRVGIYDNPPLNFFDSANEPKGIFIDVLKCIADHEDLQIEYVSDDWPVLLEKLKTGEIDVLPDIAYTVVRDSIYTLSEMPLLTSWIEIYSHIGSSIQTLDDLNHRRLAVMKNSIEHQHLNGYLLHQEDLAIEILEFPDVSSMYGALNSGRVDAFLADRFFRYSKIFEESKISGAGTFLPFNLHFAFPKGQHGEQLGFRFDKQISTLRNTPGSVYFKSLDRWLRNYFEPYIPAYLKNLIIILVLLLIVVLITLAVARYQVNMKTKSLRLSNQALLISKEKAEEGDRLKTAFLQNISHEIRTPMNGILGFIQLLQESDLEGETRDEFIRIITQSGERLMKTVNDIIEISRIETGSQEVKYSVVNTQEVLTYYESFFQPQASKKGIELSLDDRHVRGQQAVIQTDRIKLDGILLNFINNAVKYTDKGEIALGNYIEGDRLVFYVRDTGIGIAREHFEAIFDRFRQAEDQLIRNYEGAGLGLSIAKAYVEALNGEIWVESEKRKGSTFYFAIPYRPVKKEQPREIVKHWDGNGIQILLAEDDEANFLYYKFLLMKEGYQIVRASDGEQAVRIMKENPGIALILMDIKMPVLDGFEATRQIRQFNSTIPIIAQTAYGFVRDKKKAIEAGCNDYLSKPVDHHVLLRLLEEHLVKKGSKQIQ